MILTDEEKNIEMSLEALAILLKERAERKAAKIATYDYDGYYYDDDNWDNNENDDEEENY